MNILMVLTSHDQLGDTGKKTGFWLEEFAAPYYVLKDAGHTITLASPKGGTFAEHVVTDGLLITGQNPPSSEAAADALLELLEGQRQPEAADA